MDGRLAAACGGTVHLFTVLELAGWRHLRRAKKDGSSSVGKICFGHVVPTERDSAVFNSIIGICVPYECGVKRIPVRQPVRTTDDQLPSSRHRRVCFVLYGGSLKYEGSAE